MNAGVTLVEAYLRVNGYFTAREVPVIQRDGANRYEEITDIDLLAVRLPWAAYRVSEGQPGWEDDRTLAGDPKLAPAADAIDVVIAEVKEGRPRVNPPLWSDETLRTLLARVGCVRMADAGPVMKALRKRGEAFVNVEQPPMRARIRVVAFGDGDGEPGRRYEVISLAYVARFIREYLDRYHTILLAATVSDPALGLLHLLNKTEDG